jgi:hypothetical protein
MASIAAERVVRHLEHAGFVGHETPADRRRRGARAGAQAMTTRPQPRIDVSFSHKLTKTKPRSLAQGFCIQLSSLEWTFRRRAALTGLIPLEETPMRRVRVCSACGKPLTIARTTCLWCGQPKRQFSRSIIAGLVAGLSFIAGPLTVLRLRGKRELWIDPSDTIQRDHDFGPE